MYSITKVVTIMYNIVYFFLTVGNTYEYVGTLFGIWMNV